MKGPLKQAISSEADVWAGQLVISLTPKETICMATGMRRPPSKWH